jgi:hypothetical protein
MIRYCPHKFLIPPGIVNTGHLRKTKVKVSPFCLNCWIEHEDLLRSWHYQKPDDDPIAFGFCDLIAHVVKKHGWCRDDDGAENLQSELRTHLLEKREIIERAFADSTRNDVERRAYIQRLLANRLTDLQSKTSESHVIQNSESLDTGNFGKKGFRKETYYEAGSDYLTEATCGETVGRDDDYSLDDAVHKSRGVSSLDRECKALLSAAISEQYSLISNLEGNKNGHDVAGASNVRQFLTRLARIPENERKVFSARFLDEEGNLLDRFVPRGEVEKLLGLSTQNLRTLERSAQLRMQGFLPRSFHQRVARESGN